MNRHLEEIGKAVTPGAHAALIFDGAGWLVEACCDAWNSLMAMPDRIASIAARTWAKVS
jgi:hypothetical protein